MSAFNRCGVFSPMPELHEETRTARLAAGLDQLPIYERAAVYLRDVEQLPLTDVAERLGCSVATARLHLASGRVRLLTHLKTLRAR